MPTTPDRTVVIRSARWTAAGSLVARVTALFAAVIVARAVGPSQFGLLAIALLVTEIFSLFAEAGISSAVVQAQELQRVQRATLYTFEWILGVTIAAAMLGLAPAIGELASSPELSALVALAAASIIFESITRHVAAMLQRSMDFGKLTAAEIARDLTRAIGSIALVWPLGILGVILAHIAGSIVLAATLGFFGFQLRLFPGFGLAISRARSLLSFGANRAATVGLNRIGQRADQAIVAATLSPSMLGVYRLATQLTGSTLIALQSVTARVSFSMFSRQQHDRALALRSFVRLVRIQIFFMVPVTASLIILAEPLVALLFGSDWQGTGPLVSLLAVFFLLRALEGAAIPLVNGMGEAARLMRWSAATSLAYLTIVTIIALIFRDAFLIALSMASIQGIALLLFYHLMLKPLFGSFGLQYLNSVLPAALATLVAAPALLVINFLPSEWWLSAKIVGCGMIFGMIYLVCSWWLNREPVIFLSDAIIPAVRKKQDQ